MQPETLKKLLSEISLEEKSVSYFSSLPKKMI